MDFLIWSGFKTASREWVQHTVQNPWPGMCLIARAARNFHWKKVVRQQQQPMEEKHSLQAVTQKVKCAPRAG
jgi:hypothetical protein